MTISLSELLKGLVPFKDSDGNIMVQSIQNMQIVPLTTDDEFSINKFGNPLTDIVASNQRYGHLKIRNKTNKDVILPAQIAVLTKLAAQNHGMVKGATVKAGKSQDFFDAGCVQGSQHGMISESDNEIRFIPLGAREYIFEKVNVTGNHTNIYDAITRVGQETGANSGTYLDQYFEKYKKKINEFIAHFEMPKKTIGVVVLVDGEIVAVDKFPSFEYCSQIWNVLVRDCYGSVAITQEIKKKRAKSVFSEVLKDNKKAKTTKVSSYLKDVLTKTKSKIADNIKDKINEILDIELNVVKDKTDDSYVSSIIKREGYIGQVISEGTYHHLVSFVKKDSFNPERLRKASEYSNLAKKQNKFKL
jgi:hypothetical protein